MQCVIYNRVSSMRQNSYTNSVSLQAQESICSKFAHDNKLNVKSVYKEVHSAYNKLPTVLKTVINLRNRYIIISDISRFSRSVSIGLDMAKTALCNKNTIVFVQDKFVCKSHDDFIVLTQHLQKTETESRTIGIRIKTAKDYLIENGMHSGGVAPYGYDVINRKVVKNQHEQQVIEFIQECQKNDILSDSLNKLMINIANMKIYVTIECYDEHDKPVTQITERLNDDEIANLLNSYNVHKRGIRWTPSMIKTALMSTRRQIKNSKRKRPVPKTDQLSDWHDMQSEIDQIPGVISSNKKSRQNNVVGSGNGPVSQHQATRRSSRIHTNLNFDLSTDTNTLSRDALDNNIVDITPEVELFNQFRQFQKMMKK